MPAGAALAALRNYDDIGQFSTGKLEATGKAQAGVGAYLLQRQHDRAECRPVIPAHDGQQRRLVGLSACR
jgi:hypothetical protein